MHDQYGDTITVTPLPSDGIEAKINLRFSDEEESVEMMLNDRQWTDLKRAGNLALKESERIG